MAITQDNYFDLWNIFVNELVGNIWLAIILGIILIVYLAAKSNIPYQVTVLFLFIWGGIIYSATLLNEIWAFMLLIAGLLFYFGISLRFR